jgi:cytochrome c-type biogenesis protein CcmH
MPLFWFFAGALTSLAAVALLAPWLHRVPGLARLTATPQRAAASAAVLVAAIIVSWALRPAAPPASTAAASGERTSGSFGAAARLFDNTTIASAPMTASADAAAPAAKSSAGSMESAIANLEKRLAQGRGSADDWELLAKSFEFLGRPADAASARAHQLPAPGDNARTTAPGGVTVSGEVTLDSTLSGKAAPGDTLFIVAKSAASPGIPVAVYRASVAGWPVKFTLDDSQSMMPGRTLSTAGRVTIEARISRNGQPLPAAGDLQGSSGVIDPADHKPLRIRIDHVIS